MSQEIKNCSNCQKIIQFEKERDKYYSVILGKDNHIYLCPTCWESKKDYYKEQLKEEKQKEIEKSYREMGNYEKVDKDSVVVNYGICAFRSKKLGDGHGWGHSESFQFPVCFGCDKWNESEQEHKEPCPTKIAEKGELESLQNREKYPDRGLPLDSKEKQRLAELKKKYSKSNNDNPRERERESILDYFKSNNIKSIKLENNKLVIEYNNSQTENKEANTQELQAIKSYAEKLGKSELTLKDLEQSNNPSQTPKSNKVFWWGLGIVGVLVVGVIGWLLVRNNNKSK